MTNCIPPPLRAGMWLLSDDKQSLVGNLTSWPDGYNRVPRPYFPVIVRITAHRCVNGQYHVFGIDIPSATGECRKKFPDPGNVSTLWNLKPDVRDLISSTRLVGIRCHVLERNRSSLKGHLVLLSRYREGHPSMKEDSARPGGTVAHIRFASREEIGHSGISWASGS